MEQEQEYKVTGYVDEAVFLRLWAEKKKKAMPKNLLQLFRAAIAETEQLRLEAELEQFDWVLNAPVPESSSDSLTVTTPDILSVLPDESQTHIVLSLPSLSADDLTQLARVLKPEGKVTFSAVKTA